MFSYFLSSTPVAKVKNLKLGENIVLLRKQGSWIMRFGEEWFTPPGFFVGLFFFSS